MLLSLSFVAYSYGLKPGSWCGLAGFILVLVTVDHFFCCVSTVEMFFISRIVIKLHMKRLTTVGCYDTHYQIS